MAEIAHMELANAQGETAIFSFKDNMPESIIVLIKYEGDEIKSERISALTINQEFVDKFNFFEYNTLKDVA